jgi:hypothetical protein
MACDGNWHPPKTDYSPSMHEGVKGDDLNEIGCDLIYLKEANKTGQIVLGLERRIGSNQENGTGRLYYEVQRTDKKLSWTVKQDETNVSLPFKCLQDLDTVPPTIFGSLIVTGFPIDTLPSFVAKENRLNGLVNVIDPDGVHKIIPATLYGQGSTTALLQFLMPGFTIADIGYFLTGSFEWFEDEA